MPNLDVRRRIWALLVALAVAVAVGSCDAVTISPSATASPPTAPLMRFPGGGGYSFDGTTWTFHGSVNPNGSPTDVVLEVGSGTREAPAFDRSLPVAEGLILPEAFEFETDELVAPFCVRFTATNAVGTTSTPPLCLRAGLASFPPDPEVGPSPSAG